MLMRDGFRRFVHHILISLTCFPALPLDVSAEIQFPQALRLELFYLKPFKLI